MNAENRRKLCNRVSAILMALMLLCQFMPYWHHGEGLVDSINGYVWFPTDKPELTAYLTENDPAHNINAIAWPTIGVMLLCAVGVVICLWKSSSAGAYFFPAASGVLGLWFYLTTPAMRLGAAWWAHVLLLVLMLISVILGVACNRNAE